MDSTQKRRRTTTLSISLTHELSEAIGERVRSGLYTSASELVREALRLLLEVEEARRVRLEGRAADPPATASQRRFATALELMDLGLALRKAKLLAEASGLTEEEVTERLRQWEDGQEAGPGLRLAPERLERLELRD